MIEVTLAIAVVGLGMAGIMALFPVGFQASRDSIGDNYASNAAGQFMSLIARRCNDPTLDDPLDLADDTSKDFWDENISTSGVIGTSIPSPGADPSLSTFPKSIDSSNSSGTDLPVLENNIYPSSTAGVFRIKTGSSSVADFYATIRIWKSQLTGLWIFDQNADIPYNLATRLNVEISWPVDKPYASRDKRYYCIELFKQKQ